jgi:hypothetical protein
VKILLVESATLKIRNLGDEMSQGQTGHSMSRVTDVTAHQGKPLPYWKTDVYWLEFCARRRERTREIIARRLAYWKRKGLTAKQITGKRIV